MNKNIIGISYNHIHMILVSENGENPLELRTPFFRQTHGDLRQFDVVSFAVSST